jgi:hypothetical protein
MTDSIARKIAKHLHKKTVAFTADFFKKHEGYVKLQPAELSPKAKELKRLIEEGDVDFGCQQDSVIQVLEVLLGEKLGIYYNNSNSDEGPWMNTDSSKAGLIYKNLNPDNDVRVGALLMTISNDANDFIDKTGTEEYAGITYALNKFSVPTVDEIEAFVESVTVKKLGEFIVIV